MIKPKLPDKPHPSSEAGYTILEGIMAIVVVTVLLVAISPMIGFAAAVRMQAKRTQLASQAARSYVSFVKSEEIDADGDATGDRAPDNNQDGASALEEFPGPDGADINCDFDADGPENDYCGDEKVLFCVNFDETPGCQSDSPVDMIVQPIGDFRTDPDTQQIDFNRGYNLAVRVYQASSFGKGIELKGRTDEGNTETSSFMGRRDLPLIQIRTSVPPKTGNLYSTYCEDLGGCD